MGATSVGTRLGTRFGPYELQSLIGVGGMGEVYRAYDTVRERMVALKLLKTDVAADASFAARFRRESRIAARLQEPHVIPVHDFGDVDGTLFIDMRLVEGGSVKDELRANGALPPARAVAIIAQVAAALDAAHANDLVHRDIKPENVLLTPHDFAYLVDFGIAHGGGEASVTSTGLIVGSCAYMATERLNGQAGGPASDVYSLTCLLYECLTGRAPFESKDVRQVMSAHMFSAPPQPSVTRRGVNPAFDDVVAKGMAKNPADRYASAGELAKAAAVAANGRVAPVPPARPTPPHGTRQFPAVDPMPTATGYLPAPPRPTSPRKRGFSRSQVALLVATIALFALAAVLAAVVVFTGGTGTSGPSSTLAVPTTTTAPSTTTSASATSTTPAPSPTPTTAAPVAALSGTDWLGFTNHVARCDLGSKLVAAIRTASSLAVVCENFIPGSWYYHSERLSDGVDLKLGNVVPVGDGFDVINPADGARYQVRPDKLTISSNGGADSVEPALEYGPN